MLLKNKISNLLTSVLIIYINGFSQQDYTLSGPNQKQQYFYYGDEFSNFVNPASICSKGQKIGLGQHLSGDGNTGNDYFVVSSQTLPNLFLGYSFISDGASLSGNVLPYEENFYSLSLGYKFFLFARDLDIGTNFNIMTFNLFGIQKFDAKSIDLGLNYSFVKGINNQIFAGIVYQNIYNTKIERLGGETAEVPYPLIDLSGFWSFQNKKMYISATTNLHGDERTFHQLKLLCLGGILKTIVIGTQVIKYVDLKMKLTSSDRIILGVCGKLPYSNTKIEEISFCFDGNHDKFNYADKNIGINYTWFLRTIFNIF